MQENYLWDVCCVTDAGGNWDLAALPSYNGTVTAPINADTFRITKGTKHPDEAFTALSYLILGEARTKLLNSISGFPAIKADQGSYFTGLEQQKDDKGKLIYPPHVNWQVVTDAIPFADIDPNSGVGDAQLQQVARHAGQVPDQVDLDGRTRHGCRIGQAEGGTPDRVEHRPVEPSIRSSPARDAAGGVHRTRRSR